jgi:hypothetical protein
MATLNSQFRIDATDSRMLTRDELLGGVVGGLVAGLLAGLLLQVGAGDTLRAQAAMYGLSAGTATGWAVHLAHTTTIGLLYAGLMGVATDWYLTRIMSVTRRSPAAADLLRPLIDRFGITTVVTGATGLQFGIVVWLVVPVLVVPLFAGDLGVPNLAPGAVPAYVGYGLALGVVYGRLIEQ